MEDNIFDKVHEVDLKKTMETSYIDYAMSVIAARALPDVRDGLKPVQRRILYSMIELNNGPDKPHRKCARIVGDTMGKYHPHGDSSIYGALVNLAQEWSTRYPLVDGHGNFGSVDGDGAAAMRYTEARLSRISMEMTADINKNTVDFIPNFDETEKEPTVLPSRFPNLLVNGTSGIAVGMATNIPPHNLGEVTDAVIAWLDASIAGKQELSSTDLMKYITGPDFPTGGIVINKSELPAIYESGNGKIKLRGKVVFEQAKKKSEKDKLVITEIPYTMIGAGIGKFISDICDLIENKKLNDVTDISNESSKEGIRIVLELKKNADIEKIKNTLYKKTKLEDTFGVNMLAIVDQKPETLGLKEIIRHHVDFQFDLATRKYTYLLQKDLEQKEIKEGLIKACNIIDLIIEILRGAPNLKAAKQCLIDGNTENISFKNPSSRLYASQLNFTEKQAQAILELRLYKLIGLEILALEKEYNELLKRIAEYEDILGNTASMAKVIKKDLQKIKKEYATERRTVIEDGTAAVYVEEKVAEAEYVFVMDRFGYAKLIDPASYERNRETIELENKYIFSCMNTDKICVFTDNGYLHQIKALDVPVKKFRDKGVPLDNLGNYDSSGENIVFISAAGQLKNKKLLFTTTQAMMKFVDASEFEVSKRTVASTKLAEGDLIVSIYALDKGYDDFLMSEENMAFSDIVVLQTEQGVFLRFKTEEIPEKKKGAVGVRGMKLLKNDKVEKVYVMDAGDTLEVEANGVKVELRSLKLKKRDQTGWKAAERN